MNSLQLQANRLTLARRIAELRKAMQRPVLESLVAAMERFELAYDEAKLSDPWPNPIPESSIAFDRESVKLAIRQLEMALEGGVQLEGHILQALELLRPVADAEVIDQAPPSG